MKLFKQTKINSFFIKGLVHVISKLRHVKNNYFFFPQQMCFCDIEFRDVSSEIPLTSIVFVLFGCVTHKRRSETLSLRWHLMIAVLQGLGQGRPIIPPVLLYPYHFVLFFNYFLQECFPLNKIIFLLKKLIHSNTILDSGYKMANKAEKSLPSRNSQLAHIHSSDIYIYIFCLFSAFSKRTDFQI